MKILLYILGFIVLLVLGVYQYFNYKLINYQESSFKAMSRANVKESPRTFPDSMKISDEEFWNLIDDSKARFPNNPQNQINFLITTLSSSPDKKIIGFECQFREKMVELWDYKIKALYQITEGDNYVSTDDFVYFRGYLISLGREAYYKALKDTDNFNAEIDRGRWSGEDMIVVADMAYEKKHKALDETKCPRCVALDVDYDFGSYKMTGKYVDPENYDKEFPSLTKRY